MFLHGFPDGPWSFEAQMRAFAAEGFTAVAPWMRGYGSSRLTRGDGIAGNFYLSDVAHDVLMLIEALGFESAVLIGHDWGAVTASVASVLDRTRVDALAMLAVPPMRTLLGNLRGNPDQVVRSLYMAAFQVPFIPEVALRAGRGAALRWLWGRWSPGGSVPSAVRDRAIAELLEPGALAQALSWYRHLLPVYRPWLEWEISWKLTLAPLPPRGLVLAGARDGCMAPAVFEGAESAFEGPARLVTVDGAGHFMHLERPDDVNRLLLDFALG